MRTFAEILERKSGRKVSEGKGVNAQVLAAVESKGLALKATFEVRQGEVDLADHAQDATDAAVARLEDILDGMFSQDLFDPKTKTKYRTRDSVEIPDTVYGLRGSSGAFMSGLQLSRILNLILHDEVKELMGTQGRLNYRTGRLANSAQVSKIGYQQAQNTQIKNRVSIFFRYMLAPYEVFEPKHRLHKRGRSPTTLIKTAIHNALREVLSPTSFKTAIFNVEGTR